MHTRKKGPRQLDPALRVDILDRLRRIVGLQFPSVRRFGQVVEASTGTTSRWFGREASLPDAPALYRIVTKAGISLNWLMTGLGPELHDLNLPLGDVARSLRERLIGELTRLGVSREDASSFTPPGAKILDAIVKQHVASWKWYSAREKRMARLREGHRYTIADAIGKELGKE